MRHTNSYLALGDSYTIGEAVPLHESFPYQTVQILRKKGHHFHAPEIVAKTGWITSELADHILHTHQNPTYDFVTLLIGVNNQYRGLSASDYEEDFKFLLKKALQFADDKPARVTVLSIPDWGATPFAKDRDATQIAKEIDQYNEINKRLSKESGVHYIDITAFTREAANDSSLIASDTLHPSGKDYERWAFKLADILEGQL